MEKMPTGANVKHVVTIKEAPHRRSICETKMRYQVYLNGKYFDELYFNMRGYLGYLPLLDGKKLALPECGIANYRKEAALINRQAKSMTTESASGWQHDGCKWIGVTP